MAHVGKADRLDDHITSQILPVYVRSKTLAPLSGQVRNDMGLAPVVVGERVTLLAHSIIARFVPALDVGSSTDTDDTNAYIVLNLKRGAKVLASWRTSARMKIHIAFEEAFLHTFKISGTETLEVSMWDHHSTTCEHNCGRSCGHVSRSVVGETPTMRLPLFTCLSEQKNSTLHLNEHAISRGAPPRVQLQTMLLPYEYLSYVARARLLMLEYVRTHSACTHTHRRPHARPRARLLRARAHLHTPTRAPHAHADVCAQVTTTRWFHHGVTALILINCICSTAAYIDVALYNVVAQSDVYFLVLFTVETLCNIVAYGLWHHADTPRPYPGFINEGWKVMDAFVVVAGWFGVFSTSANITSFRLLRQHANI